MRFEKWQALGNDYLIIEAGQLPFELTPARVRGLCASHVGIGADGVLLLSPATDPAHVADLRIFNPDGSEAELSGNGAREAILYLRRHGWTERDQFTIHTPAGEIRPTITGPDTCRVDMGQAKLSSGDVLGAGEDGRGTVTSGGRDWSYQHVCVGNPQCAIRVTDERELDALDLPALGPAIEADAQFPNRTNVSWYTEIEQAQPDGAPARIRARIFERGVGETLSSGTGATGAAVAYVLERDPAKTPPRTPSQRPPRTPSQTRRVAVALDGGELLVDVHEDLRVDLTGWARPVFAGAISDEFIKELHETE